MFIEQPPWFYRALFPGVIWRIPAKKKCVYLTFDDGPHPVYTPQLLDGLNERGVHATFFVVGKNILGNEALLKRMETEGHLIGNHTYSHVKLSTRWYWTGGIV